MGPLGLWNQFVFPPVMLLPDEEKTMRRPPRDFFFDLACFIYGLVPTMQFSSLKPAFDTSVTILRSVFFFSSFLVPFYLTL